VANVNESDLQFLRPGNSDTYIDLSIHIYVKGKLIKTDGRTSMRPTTRPSSTVHFIRYLVNVSSRSTACLSLHQKTFIPTAPISSHCWRKEAMPLLRISQTRSGIWIAVTCWRAILLMRTPTTPRGSQRCGIELNRAKSGNVWQDTQRPLQPPLIIATWCTNADKIHKVKERVPSASS
jgi:hypothetical protein